MQVFLADNLPSIAVAGATSVSLAATANGLSTTATIGGQQYALTSPLTLSTGSTGAGGLDTGSLGAIQLWYVYLIVNSATFALALIASQTSPTTGPSIPGGYFSAYKLAGAFYTNSSSQVGSGVPIIGTATTGWMTFVGTYASQTGGTVTGKYRRVGDSVEIESVIDSPTAWGIYHELTVPAALTFNTTNLVTLKTVVGTAILRVSNSSFVYPGSVVVASSTGVRPGGGGAQTDFWAASITSPAAYTANQGSSSMHVLVPVSGWNSTLL